MARLSTDKTKAALSNQHIAVGDPLPFLSVRVLIKESKGQLKVEALFPLSAARQLPPPKT